MYSASVTIDGEEFPILMSDVEKLSPEKRARGKEFFLNAWYKIVSGRRQKKIFSTPIQGFDPGAQEVFDLGYRIASLLGIISKKSEPKLSAKERRELKNHMLRTGQGFGSVEFKNRKFYILMEQWMNFGGEHAYVLIKYKNAVVLDALYSGAKNEVKTFVTGKWEKSLARIWDRHWDNYLAWKFNIANDIGSPALSYFQKEIDEQFKHRYGRLP